VASAARADHPGEGPFSGWKTSHLAEGTLAGIQPTVTRVAGTGADATHAGAVARFWAEYFGRSWYPGETKLFRFVVDGTIGADTSGLLGSIRNEMSLGLRFPFSSSREDASLEKKAFFAKLSEDEKRDARAIFGASRHAIFARLGYGASLGGDRAFYASLLEAPRLEVGYQLDDESGRAGVELRAEGGMAIVGRYFVGDAARSIGLAPAYGARVVVHSVDATHLELGWKRVDERSGVGTAIDYADSMACVDLGGFRVPVVRALCMNARMITGDVDRAGARATALQAGLLLSLSWME